MNECGDNQRLLAVDDRQLATILAALRFHQAENLQGGAGIADRAIEEIATDAGELTALDFDEVEGLCQMLNTTRTSQTF
jgi:hypothetical protein